MPTDKECLYLSSCAMCPWVRIHSYLGGHECRLPKVFYGIPPYIIEQILALLPERTFTELDKFLKTNIFPPVLFEAAMLEHGGYTK